jgi:DNA-binding transcriptional ArsR family regulator
MSSSSWQGTWGLPNHRNWGSPNMTTPLYKLKAEFFKTLGHPARIRILELLADGEHSVGQLQELVGLEGSHMSQQLAVLRRAGVVVARKQGNSVIYSMASPDMAELMAVARKVLTGLLNDQVDLLTDLTASTRAASRGALMVPSRVMGGPDINPPRRTRR